VSSQTALGAQGKVPVQDNRGQDQDADHGPLPERRDSQDGKGGGDGGQEDGAQCGPVDRADTAGDGHPANHSRHDSRSQPISTADEEELAQPTRDQRGKREADEETRTGADQDR